MWKVRESMDFCNQIKYNKVFTNTVIYHKGLRVVKEHLNDIFKTGKTTFIRD